MCALCTAAGNSDWAGCTTSASKWRLQAQKRTWNYLRRKDRGPSVWFGVRMTNVYTFVCAVLHPTQKLYEASVRCAIKHHSAAAAAERGQHRGATCSGDGSGGLLAVEGAGGESAAPGPPPLGAGLGAAPRPRVTLMACFIADLTSPASGRMSTDRSRMRTDAWVDGGARAQREELISRKNKATMKYIKTPTYSIEFAFEMKRSGVKKRPSTSPEDCDCRLDKIMG